VKSARNVFGGVTASVITVKSDDDDDDDDGVNKHL
jgi:hypothetical protein